MRTGSWNQYVSTGLFICALAGGILIPSQGVSAGLEKNAPGPAAYVADFESLPLMPGLTEKKSDRVNFDTPAGRIVEAVAVGNLSRRHVESFYIKTLPQLGWQKIGPLKFKREGEGLLIDFPAGQSKETTAPNNIQMNLIVRFTIRPFTTP